MEEFTLLGNAAAVPFIIGATQLLKKNFSFKYKADIVSLFVALIICPGWWFYITPEVEIRAALDGGVIEVGKFILNMLLVSAATWLSATKSYDLFSGNKKREKEKKEIVDKHETEKKELLARIESLETPSKGGENNGPENNNEVGDKLLEILEGRD